VPAESVLWRNSKWVSKLALMAIACLASLWAVDNSIKSDADILRPGAIIPFLQVTPSLDMWFKVLCDPQLQKWMFNGARVRISATVLALVSGTPAAYILARFEFKGVKSRDVTLWFLSRRVLFLVVVLTPFYILLGLFRQGRILKDATRLATPLTLGNRNQ
jgi:multiple sugar transport system permease protein